MNVRKLEERFAETVLDVAEFRGETTVSVQAGELLPVCRALATDMLSCDPKVLRDYKRLIDEGYGMSFSDAMHHEAEAAIRSAAGVTADEIAARREGVMERGRKRSGI